MSARSYLFVPGDREAMLDRAAGRPADALIADLEDAVAPAERAAARSTVASWLARSDGAGPARWVRINLDTMAEDVAAVADASIAGVVVPRVRSAAELDAAGGLLAAVESRRGIAPGTIGLMPMVETAAVLEHLPAVARVPRVARLMIGEMDLGAELGIHFDDWEMWLPVRMQLVVASAAAGLPGPVGPVPRDYRDLDRVRAGTSALRRMGFRARAAIHPDQLAIINEAMSPSAEEIEDAVRIVDRFEAALAAGRGAAVDHEGRMVDEAIVRSARDLLDTARRDGATS